MLAKLKMCAGIALTALFALLAGFGIYQKRRSEKAEEEAEKADKEAMHANQRAETQKELNQVKHEAEKREKSDAEAIQKIKDSKLRPDEFSSNSLFDD